MGRKRPAWALPQATVQALTDVEACLEAWPSLDRESQQQSLESAKRSVRFALDDLEARREGGPTSAEEHPGDLRATRRTRPKHVPLASASEPLSEACYNPTQDGAPKEDANRTADPAGQAQGCRAGSDRRAQGRDRQGRGGAPETKARQDRIVAEIAAFLAWYYSDEYGEEDSGKASRASSVIGLLFGRRGHNSLDKLGHCARDPELWLELLEESG